MELLIKGEDYSRRISNAAAIGMFLLGWFHMSASKIELSAPPDCIESEEGFYTLVLSVV
jgi:hypothetical protein